MCKPHILYLFICLWIPRLLPCLGYCKQCCYGYWGAYIFWIMVFSGYLPRRGIGESYGSSIFSFLRNFHIDLHMAAPIYIPTNRVGRWIMQRSQDYVRSQSDFFFPLRKIRNHGRISNKGVTCSHFHLMCSFFNQLFLLELYWQRQINILKKICWLQVADGLEKVRDSPVAVTLVRDHGWLD